MNQNQICRITTLIDGYLYQKIDVKIPEDKSLKTFFDDKLEEFKIVLNKKGSKIRAFILTNITSSLYWVDSIGGIYEGSTSPEGLEMLPFPAIINFHNNTKINNKEKYLETEFCKENPEIYGFIIPDTEEKAKKFIKFCVDVLGKELEELVEGNIVENWDINLDFETCEMLDSNLEFIKDVYGDDFIYSCEDDDTNENITKQDLADVLNDFKRTIGGTTYEKVKVEDSDDVCLSVRHLGNWIHDEGNEDEEDDDNEIWAEGQYEKYLKIFEIFVNNSKVAGLVDIDLMTGEKNYCYFSLTIK